MDHKHNVDNVYPYASLGAKVVQHLISSCDKIRQVLQSGMIITKCYRTRMHSICFQNSSFCKTQLFKQF